MPARTRRSRQRSIRSILALILFVPAVCMLALWAVAARVTVSHAAQARDFRSAEWLYSGPGQALASALTAERLQAVSWLSGGRQGAVAPLRTRFRATDEAAAAFLSAVRASRPTIPSSARPALTTAESALAGRAPLRAGVTAGRVTPLAAAQAYSSILSAELSLDARLVGAGDTPLYRQAAATVEADRAVDLMSGEVALVATAGPGGRMSAPALLLLARDVAGQRLLMSEALAQLEPGLRVGYERVLASGAYRAVAAAEDRIVAAADGQGGPALVAAAVPLLRGYQAAERQNLAGLAGLAAHASDGWLLAAVLTGGVGLIVVVALIGLMAWFGFRISRGLTGLRRAAAVVAVERLPELTGDPGEAGDVVVATSGARTIREIADTAQALTAVWRAAVQAAAERATQRGAASALVRNAALRSQDLLRRQLRAIGELEREATEPRVRAGLAAVGRVATHLQLHADGLLILAGEEPGRGPRGPLPVGEVLRSAAAELDGPRVKVVAESGDMVAAAAVAGVIQLVAELTEYVARDARPETEITLRAGRVGRGLAIEVENRVSGLGERELDRANAALAGSTAESFPADGQLGLHVAGRLAAKHEITVTLRRTPGGGLVAIALLPHANLVAGTGRATIVDGSLPRIDHILPRAELAPSPADSSAATSGPALPASTAGERAGALPTGAGEPTGAGAGAPASAVGEPAAAGAAALESAVGESTGPPGLAAGEPTGVTVAPALALEDSPGVGATARASAVEAPPAADAAGRVSAAGASAGATASAVEDRAGALASALDESVGADTGAAGSAVGESTGPPGPAAGEPTGVTAAHALAFEDSPGVGAPTRAPAVEAPPAADTAGRVSAAGAPAGAPASAVEDQPGAFASAFGEPPWAGTAAPASTAEKPPTAASPAPWYWLTSSEPAPRPAVEPPASATSGPPPADPGTPAPLPRRVRNASLAARPRPRHSDAGSQLRGDGGDDPPGGVSV